MVGGTQDGSQALRQGPVEAVGSSSSDFDQTRGWSRDPQRSPPTPAIQGGLLQTARGKQGSKPFNVSQCFVISGLMGNPPVCGKETRPFSKL